MNYERPGHTLICLCPEKPLLLACTGTVANHLGDYGAVSLAFSDIITRNLHNSGYSCGSKDGKVAQEGFWVTEMFSFSIWTLVAWACSIYATEESCILSICAFLCLHITLEYGLCNPVFTYNHVPQTH